MAGDFLKHSGVLITALGAQAPDTVSTEDTSFRGPKEIIKHAPTRCTEAGRITSGCVRDYRQALTSPWTPGCQIHPLLLLQSPSSRSLVWQPSPRAQGREERVPRNPLPGARFGVGAIMTRLLSSAPSTPRPRCAPARAVLSLPLGPPSPPTSEAGRRLPRERGHGTRLFRCSVASDCLTEPVLAGDS